MMGATPQGYDNPSAAYNPEASASQEQSIQHTYTSEKDPSLAFDPAAPPPSYNDVIKS